MGRSQRVKGRAYEQHVAREFRRVWPKAKRGIGQARSSAEVPDVDPHPDWWVECKHQRSCSWRGAWKQATEANGGKRKQQLVVTRDNGAKDFAHLPLADLLDLLEELERWRNETWVREATELAHAGEE